MLTKIPLMRAPSPILVLHIANTPSPAVHPHPPSIIASYSQVPSPTFCSPPTQRRPLFYPPRSRAISSSNTIPNPHSPQFCSSQHWSIPTQCPLPNTAPAPKVPLDAILILALLPPLVFSQIASWTRMEILALGTHSGS